MKKMNRITALVVAGIISCTSPMMVMASDSSSVMSQAEATFSDIFPHKTRSAPVVAYRGDYYEKNCMCNDTDTHHYSVFRSVLSNCYEPGRGDS